MSPRASRGDRVPREHLRCGGGCQAEIGTASAMAAGALVSLRGGTNEQIGHAVAMALKNLMGLVCDPVAGLVEVPVRQAQRHRAR